jgi:hypothetical protein
MRPALVPPIDTSIKTRGRAALEADILFWYGARSTKRMSDANARSFRPTANSASQLPASSSRADDKKLGVSQVNGLRWPGVVLWNGDENEMFGAIYAKELGLAIARPVVVWFFIDCSIAEAEKRFLVEIWTRSV